MEVGTLLSMVVRSPSCPAELEPQQFNSPEDSIAHECAPPQLNDNDVAKNPENVMVADECDRMRVGVT